MTLISYLQMEKVGIKMLERLVQDEDAVLVLFAKEASKDTETVLDDLERYVHKLERSNVAAVVCLAPGTAGRLYGLPSSPSGIQLVLFEHGVPSIIAEGAPMDPVAAVTLVQESIERQEISTVNSQVKSQPC